MTEYLVRKALKSDAAVLEALEHDAFGDRSWGAAGVAGSFGAPGVEILFCSRSGAQPVGFAIWRALPGEAELLSIGVAPDRRRGGAGAALLDAVIDAAGRVGARAIHLEVDPGNRAAMALYIRAGFAETGRRKAYYRSGADATLMSKRV